MKRLLGWYGAGPLHLLSLLACFALAGYAAVQLIPSRPLGVAVWFLGAVIGHDLVLVPLYSLADRSAVAVFRHSAPGLPTVAWINYVRVPAALSGLLLLVWFPLILRLTAVYHASTTLSADPYLWHWLAVTGALFLLSAIAFAVRLRATRHDDSDDAGPAGGGHHDDRPCDESSADDKSPEGSPSGNSPGEDAGPADDQPRQDGSPDLAEHTAGRGPRHPQAETLPGIPERAAGEFPGLEPSPTAAEHLGKSEPAGPADE